MYGAEKKHEYDDLVTGQCERAMTENAPPSGEKAHRLYTYLREQARDGEYYFKSKYICDEVDLTARQIGRLVTELQDQETDICIEQWSYANATTWRVTVPPE